MGVFTCHRCGNPCAWMSISLATMRHDCPADNPQPTRNTHPMKDIYTQAFHDTPVREFHEAFNHPISLDPRHTPAIEQRELRVRMIAEELVELARAFGVQLKVDSTEDEDEAKCVLVRANAQHLADYDPVEAADALGDLRYLIDGSNLVCGFPGELVLAEIHRSNMSKLGEDGKPVRRADGKSMKGPNYFKPNIARVLGLQ